MNFNNCATYVDRALAGDPDPASTIALSVAAWFFDEALKTVKHFDDVERDLHLMSAPQACSLLCRLIVNGLGETVIEVMRMQDNGPTYDGRFDSEVDIDDGTELDPGRLQAYQIAHICLTDHEVSLEDYQEYAIRIAHLLMGIADTFESPDMKTISLSLVGMIPEKLELSKQSEIADAIMKVFDDHSVELSNSVLNFYQLSDDIEEDMK
jgi:hypothetical protein